MTGLLGAALWITAVVAGGVCLFRAFWEFLALALGVSAHALGPRQPGTPDPRIPAVAVEPAHRAYWSQLMWLDAWSATAAGVAAVRHRLTARWMAVTARRMFQGRQPSTGFRFDHGLARFVVRLVAPGTALGAIAGAVLALLVTSAIQLLLCLFLTVLWLSALASVAMLRGADRVGALVRHVRMKCPYPGCYLPFPLAVHLCPGCGAAHRELRPGRFGALWHVCTCGHRLVTTSLTGRDRLAAQCPYCDQQLPVGIGKQRIVHVPIVGGTSSGKTMLMAAVVAGLHSWAGQSRLTVAYATTDDSREAVELKGQLNGTGWALKTQGGQPRAFMLRVSYGRRRRLLYLYDPMGESLYDADSVQRQQYLAHADGVVLVMDVLADAQVRRSLSGEDLEHARRARPSDLGPWDTYQVLTGELSALAGRRTRRRLPVAAVVTKRDALDRIEALRVPSTGIDAWLRTVGLDPLVRDLKHRFRSRRFWAVSSYAATGTGPLESEQRRAAEPVLWILEHSGLRVGRLSESGRPKDRTRSDVPGPRAESVPDRSSR